MLVNIYRIPFKIDKKGFRLLDIKDSVMNEKEFESIELVKIEKTGKYVSEEEFENLDSEFWTVYPTSLENKDSIKFYNSRDVDFSSYVEFITTDGFQIMDEIHDKIIKKFNKSKVYVQFRYAYMSKLILNQKFYVLDTNSKYLTINKRPLAIRSDRHNIREHKLILSSALSKDTKDLVSGIAKGSLEYRTIMVDFNDSLGLISTRFDEFRKYIVLRSIKQQESIIESAIDKKTKLENYLNTIDDLDLL